MNSQHFPAGLRDPLKHFTGMHKGIDADLIVSLPPFSHPLLSCLLFLCSVLESSYPASLNSSLCPGFFLTGK